MIFPPPLFDFAVWLVSSWLEKDACWDASFELWSPLSLILLVCYSRHYLSIHSAYALWNLKYTPNNSSSGPLKYPPQLQSLAALQAHYPSAYPIYGFPVCLVKKIYLELALLQQNYTHWFSADFLATSCLSICS